MKIIILLTMALLICISGVSCASKAPAPQWATTMVENISNGMNQNIVAAQLRAQQVNNK